MTDQPPSRQQRRALAIVTLCLVALGLPQLHADDLGDVGAHRVYSRPLDAAHNVSTANGAYHFDTRLLSLGGPMDLSFGIVYRSDFGSLGASTPPDTPPSFWWYPRVEGLESVSPYDLSTPVFTVRLGRGDFVSFIDPLTNGTWRLVVQTDIPGYSDNSIGTEYTLLQTPTYLYLKDPVRERVYMFERNVGPAGEARLRTVLDRNYNSLTYTYSTTSNTVPATIADNLGRTLTFSYGAQGAQPFLQSVTDHGGRSVGFLQEEQGADNSNEWTLRGLSNAVGDVTIFQYQPGLTNKLAAQILPEGNVPITITYATRVLNSNAAVRVVAQVDTNGYVSAFSYASNANIVTVQPPDANSWVYEHFSHHGLPVRVTDPDNNSSAFVRDAKNRISTVTDRAGAVTSFDYHPPCGRPQSLVNAKEQTTTIVYAPSVQSFTNPANLEVVPLTFYDSRSIAVPGGPTTTMFHDIRGNPTNLVDPAGFLWRCSYDSSGLRQTIANPTAGLISNTYDAAGMLVGRTDTDTGVTVYQYDPLNRLVARTDPEEFRTIYQYDALDRLTAVEDPTSNRVRIVYDFNGRVTDVTDPVSNVTRYAYDELNRLTNITDALTNVTSFSYDNMGRVSRISHADSSYVEYAYDKHGRRSTVRDMQTNEWSLMYDAEGFAVASSDPLGHTRTTVYDELGLVRLATDPLQRSCAIDRDSGNRVSRIRDGSGQATDYSYDVRGGLSNVSQRVIGSARYSVDPLDNISQVTDLNGGGWVYNTTLEGRCTSLTDPNTNQCQSTYTTAGRIATVTYPDGVICSNTYATSNRMCVFQQSYSDGLRTGMIIGPVKTPTPEYSCEVVASPLTTNEPVCLKKCSADGYLTSSEVSGGYVQEPRVSLPKWTGKVCAPGWAGGRLLKSITYSNTNFKISYSYDLNNNLCGVQDSLSGHGVTFTRDKAGRITQVDRTNGISTIYDHDDAGYFSRIREGAFADIQITRDNNARIVSMTTALPCDPADYIGDDTNSYEHGNASELTSAGYLCDKRGRLTNDPSGSYEWNAVSLLTRAGGISMDYNGFGQLCRQIEGPQTNFFVRNDAVPGAPVWVDVNENLGAVSCYYVHAPDGRLLYLVDAANGNAVSYYHYNHVGSTIALTDTNGILTDAYAYTPYGTLLQHTGPSPQPYTYVGQFGVRQTGPSGTLYQMGCRYYDSMTAQFLSRDPVWPVLSIPRSLNPYQYALNNPVSNTDPSGRFTLMELIRTMGLVNILDTIGASSLSNDEVESSVVAIPTFLRSGLYDSAGDDRFTSLRYSEGGGCIQSFADWPNDDHTVAGVLSIQAGNGSALTTVQLGNNQQLAVEGGLSINGGYTPGLRGGAYVGFTRGGSDGYSVRVGSGLTIDPADGLTIDPADGYSAPVHGSTGSYPPISQGSGQFLKATIEGRLLRAQISDSFVEDWKMETSSCESCHQRSEVLSSPSVSGRSETVGAIIRKILRLNAPGSCNSDDE